MSKSPAASVGLALAGVALAAAFLPWTGSGVSVASLTVGSVAGAALAGLALLAFLLRRHDVIPRSWGAPLAGTASFAVVGVAAYALLAPATAGVPTPDVGRGLPIAAIAGLVSVGAAAADGAGVSTKHLVRMVQDVSTAAAVGLISFLVGMALSVIPASIVADAGFAIQFGVFTTFFGLGLALSAIAYLKIRDIGLDYIDIRRPSRRDLAYAVGGIVALYGAAIVIGLILESVGLSGAESSIEQQAREGNPTLLLVLIPLSWLVIGPGEELVFRNIVQKSLYDSFSEKAAVIVASIIFALIHIPQYYSATNPASTVTTLAVIFILSLLLGETYRRTKNLVVPILIHGTFNAVQFAQLYVQLAGSPV
ncbi:MULTISPECIES: CPBP family intramembrane glutamic endopeptidase [unclassified Haladaptatus]|uniref:CPBP family intramembrane glutamic endopeptidase n=1 Tax=unclassified Haladaptatus TaxID=2622732 RepID=UPI0023E7ED7D|nr:MULTISPECIES: type II CAAX endopeptidase family protein [unclassified Haladaptatus]